MFKKFSILCAVGAVLVLAACGGRAETTTICELNEIDFMGEILPGYSAIEFDAVGDRVNVRRERLVFDLTGEEDDIDEVVAGLEEMIELFVMVLDDGITSDVIVGDDSTVTWLITTDFDAMSEEDLETYLQGYDFISLELSVEGMEDDEGFTCRVVDNDDEDEDEDEEEDEE